jgi:hypothetical protein
MEFQEALARMDKRIRVACQRDRLPGLLPSEVRSEMLECLWRAAQTYEQDKNDSFDAWYFLLWNQHKARHLRSFFAQKRAQGHEVLTNFEMEAFHPLIEGPEASDSTPPSFVAGVVQRRVWAMLAAGYKPSEVRSMLNLSLRRYYGIIHEWRSAW